MVFFNELKFELQGLVWGVVFVFKEKKEND